jgi:hypothetical protein
MSKTIITATKRKIQATSNGNGKKGRSKSRAAIPMSSKEIREAYRRSLNLKAFRMAHEDLNAK